MVAANLVFPARLPAVASARRAITKAPLTGIPMLEKASSEAEEDTATQEAALGTIVCSTTPLLGGEWDMSARDHVSACCRPQAQREGG